MKTRVSHSYDFTAGGNAGAIQVSGWSGTEPDQTWSIGRHSVVAIDDVVAPHGFFLEIFWYPFTVYPYRRHQSVQVTVSHHHISPYQLAQEEVTAFYCPPPLMNDKKILITFDCPDAARISDYHQTIDQREVAIALRRLRILPLEERPPVRLRNRSAEKTFVRDGLVHMRGGEASVQARTLLRDFEVLAGNCDLGLAIRTLGVEQLSFLRFAGATTEVAVRGLDTGFDGVGEDLSTEIADNPIREWMVRDGFGLRFHTHQSSEAMAEAEILKRQRVHIHFLRRKFLEDVALGEKIFVYADHLRPGNFENALALFLALKRQGGRKMLWVCQGTGQTEPGQVDEVLPGFAQGSLDPFDGPLEAGHITVAGWVNVLWNATMVLNGELPVTTGPA